MGKSIKLTSKRQATFPVEVCNGLGVGPGDELVLTPRLEDGEQVWVLRKKSVPEREWMGSLSAFAGNASEHSMDSIRKSIASGRASGK